MMDAMTPRYHPLVDADSSGTVKVPMFMSTDRDTIRAVHSTYLAEIIPNYFRLHSKKPIPPKVSSSLSIRCPRCGAELSKVADACDSNTLELYTCRMCRD